jgi:hypothetical protein
MHRHKHGESEWMKCTLCRSHKIGSDVLKKASQRKIEWPQQKSYGDSPLEDPVVFTTIDDAFASIMQYMSTTTRQCKRYYKCCSPQSIDHADENHCRRFHSPAYTSIQRRNPLETAEDVHLLVQPGTYAVSAGEWGTSRQQTHVVHVEPGNTINLDFVM